MNEVTCYIPFSSSNQYSENIKNAIKENGYRVCSIKQVIRNPRLFYKCKIINFNWYESLDKHKPALYQYILKNLLIRLFKLSNKKLVFTLHNRIPHELVSEEGYEIRLMKLLAQKSDSIIGMCQDTRQVVADLDSHASTKLTIIPHPNYVNNYPQNGIENGREKYGFTSKDVVFLFLGFISPYKNVDLLIECLGSTTETNIKLLVAGSVSDQQYKSKLQSMACGYVNIVCDFRYVPDEEIADLYRCSDIIIMPYKKESVLNSGAMYLSFSLGRTVICPEIGSVKDLLSRDFIYSYDYSDENEHRKALEERIHTVIEDVKTSQDILKIKGEMAKDYVKKFHSLDTVTEAYGQLYKELLEKK